MNKKKFYIIKIALLAFAVGVTVCACKNKEFSDSAVSEKDNKADLPVEAPVSEDREIKKDDEVANGIITKIDIESVKGITAKEAEELCYAVMGEKDEETGFLFSFGTSGAVERDGKQYYVVRASWLVNNSHMSYIGDFFVSADGKEIYSGTALPETDEYTMDTKIFR